MIFFSACSNSNSLLAIIVFMSLSSSKPTKAKMAKMFPKLTASVCSPALSRDAPECPLDQQEFRTQGFWCHRAQRELHVSKCTQKTRADWAWFEGTSVQCLTLKENTDLARGVVLTVINNYHKNRYKCKISQALTKTRRAFVHRHLCEHPQVVAWRRKRRTSGVLVAPVRLVLATESGGQEKTFPAAGLVICK